MASIRRFGSIVVLCLLLATVSKAQAGEVIYRSTNKLDLIKLDKAKKSEAAGGLSHPYTFDPVQMREILGSIHFNKNVIFLRDVEDRDLFDAGNVEFLSPYLIEAFQKAKNNEVVTVSYFTRSSKFVIQDDRLSVFRAYVKDDGLHIKFSKLYAKLLGDRTTQGADRAASQARGMRVSLEPQKGQDRISWDPEELVFDLHYFVPGGSATAKKEEIVPEKKTTKKSEQVTTKKSASTSMDTGEKSVKRRLEELEQLRKDELITDKEYQQKRKELIREL